jgi:nucleotide-binding universal stress UspA family protein
MKGGQGKAKPAAAAERGQRRALVNVLVATDFSPGASHAVARAVRLPMAAGATITLLNVLPSNPRPRVVGAARRALAQQASAARRAARGVGLQNVSVFTCVARGKPFVEVIGCARDLKAQLIVLGRHGRGTFRDLLLGSTAERVLRKSATPVLVVTAHAAGPYLRPLVAVDDSETCRRAFELMLQIVGPGANCINVVHAYSAPYEEALWRTGLSEKELREYRLAAKNEARTMVDAFLAVCARGERAVRVSLRRGDPRRVILHVAAQRRSDLLALGTQGRSGPVHVLIGSVAEAVVRAAPCDVLLARPAKLVFRLP